MDRGHGNRRHERTYVLIRVHVPAGQADELRPKRHDLYLPGLDSRTAPSRMNRQQVEIALGSAACNLHPTCIPRIYRREGG